VPQTLQRTPATFGNRVRLPRALELQQGLDGLILAYDERVAAIDAGDHARWDAANVTIAQLKFNIVEKAVAEMACWPKGVHIGDDTSTTAWPCAS
jgi:hypothetical protein